MNKRLSVMAVFLVGCAVGGASSAFVVPKASAQQAATLTKWEYACRTTNSHVTELANQLGAEGWEMAAIRVGVDRRDFDSHDDIYCFKRPKM